MEKEKSRFDEYLLKEYSVISEAHFKTIDSISSFFKNYLILMAIPITLLGSSFGLKSVNFIDKFFGNISKTSEIDIKVFCGLILITVSLIGFSLFLYICVLRFDAILYARAVNGIRKYFFDSSELDRKNLDRYRVLPQSPFLPSYNEFNYFFPIILTFSLFDTLYLVLGLVSLSLVHLNNYAIALYYTAPPILFILLHKSFYDLLARDRELKYLKSNIIGIDIDGVLNKHREQFCKIYGKITNKTINPDDINFIPVQESKLNISNEEADKVFNDPKYWIDMPVNDNAAKIVDKLQKSFNYKIYIFTARDWPIISYHDTNEKNNIIKSWKSSLKSLKIFGWRYFCYLTTKERFKKSAINLITKNWLLSNNINFDKLIIEKGNEYQAYPKSKLINRFQISRKDKIKYFIEDDLEKAKKLSFICDVVFLIKHPYNQSIDELPSNIIIVDDWNNLYDIIKKLA